MTSLVPRKVRWNLRPMMTMKASGVGMNECPTFLCRLQKLQLNIMLRWKYIHAWLDVDMILFPASTLVC